MRRGGTAGLGGLTGLDGVRRSHRLNVPNAIF
ncbi:hypothetical protein BJY21_001312 [Kineosphaera limosa]|nr:hypothetical protein [Kineosphaera limosa]